MPISVPSVLKDGFDAVISGSDVESRIDICQRRRAPSVSNRSASSSNAEAGIQSAKAAGMFAIRITTAVSKGSSQPVPIRWWTRSTPCILSVFDNSRLNLTSQTEKVKTKSPRHIAVRTFLFKLIYFLLTSRRVQSFFATASSSFSAW